MEKNFKRIKILKVSYSGFSRPASFFFHTKIAAILCQNCRKCCQPATLACCYLSKQQCLFVSRQKSAVYVRILKKLATDQCSGVCFFQHRKIWNRMRPIHAESTNKGVTCFVFACMPGESYRRRLGSLSFYLCYVFWALINSLVCSVNIRWQELSLIHISEPTRPP